jgi:pyruvate kinase
MRRTRVVATIGPSSWDSENLAALFDAGADVFRLNYSHGEPEHKTEPPVFWQICQDLNCA